MKRAIAACAALALGLASGGPALAWGWEGHEYIGNLAYNLLSGNAKQHVNALLSAYEAGKPISLAEAAVWPDCIRDIGGPDAGPHKWTQKAGTSAACIPFGQSATQRPLMEDYADRNWTNCEYAHHQRECHKAYHFDDVNVYVHNDYGTDYFGAEKSDVVRAIKAAITVLQCPPAQTCSYEGPFNIKDKREALFLLAHFVGDLHQPLHVGAVYLTPAYAPGDDTGSATAGGNLLLLSPGQTSNNLHHHWDAIEASLGTHPTATLVQAACNVPTGTVPLLDRPATWATGSVVAAKTAYDKMTFTKDPTLGGYWDITFADRQAYDKAVKATQREQLKLGGAHLAEVLNAIWPGGSKAQACT